MAPQTQAAVKSAPVLSACIRATAGRSTPALAVYSISRICPPTIPAAPAARTASISAGSTRSAAMAGHARAMQVHVEQPHFCATRLKRAGHIDRDGTFAHPTLAAHHHKLVADLFQGRLDKHIAHAGTHLDFPAHFFPNGKRAGDYPADAFLLPAVVISCGRLDRLGPDVLTGVDFAPGDAVLFATRNSDEGLFRGAAFPEHFACLTPELAHELVRRRAGLAGLDAMSVEPLTDPTYPVHRILLGAGIRILEGLDLRGVLPGRYTLSCLPLAIPDAEASPVRAVLA